MWQVLALVAACALQYVHAGNEPLCSVSPGTYASAKQAHPDMAFGLAELEKRGIAMWYTDRDGDYASKAQQIVSQCPSSSRMTIVVYGMPHKDCAAGFSAGGSVQNDGAYQQFLSQLQQTVGDRKVLYIVEPDALGLLASNPCATSNGYEKNLGVAIKTLSQNPNADLYLDVGHWVLASESDRGKVVSAVKRLQGAGRLKGISINTSNYRSNNEVSGLCSSFRSAAGGDLHCVIDTSRNYNGPSAQNEWCNYKNAAIGKAPTGSTGDPNIDYFIWIKPAGESDGPCSGMSSDAMQGPGAGSFFPEYFKQLWNNGALVKELGLPRIDGTVHQVTDQQTSAPTWTSAPTTAAPTTSAPKQTTAAPTTATPTTEAPTKEVPSNTNHTTSTASSDTGVAADADTEAGTVAPATEAPETTEPVVPVTTPTAASSIGSGSQAQIKTKSEAQSSMSSGIVVMIALVGVAAVVLVVVVAFRVRQARIEEAKSPMELDPRIQCLSRFSDVSAL